MTLSEETKTLLSKINALSGNRLQRSLDFARLLETALQTKKGSVLDDLAFRAKFVTKTFDIMKRIGERGEGYDKLYAEFSENIKNSQQLIASLIAGAEKEVQAHFSATYLSINERTMENVMQLLHDLSWYKNFQIDSRHSSS